MRGLPATLSAHPNQLSTINDRLKMTDRPMEIDVAGVKAKLDSGEDCLFLDCREQQEFDAVKIEGTTLIPMSELQERVGELESHKDREIIVHCHHGGRSLRVAMFLRQNGYATATSMAGGIDAWAVEIEPGMARY